MTNLDDRRQAPAPGPQSLPQGWHHTASGPAQYSSGSFAVGRAPYAPQGYAGQGWGGQGHSGAGYGGAGHGDPGYGHTGWSGQGYPPAGFPQAPISHQPFGGPGLGMPQHPQQPPRSNSWAMAALIVGIVCLAMSPLPILNQAGILVGFVGVGLSVPAIIIGLRHRVRAVMSFVALGLSILGLIASFAFTAYFVSQLDAAFAPSSSSEAASPFSATTPAAPVTYTLEATSSDDEGLVTWANGEGGIEQDSSAPMPWSRTVTVDGERSLGVNFSVSTSSSSSGNSNTVTCRLLADGQVVDEQTSRGMYATASCDAY